MNKFQNEYGKLGTSKFEVSYEFPQIDLSPNYVLVELQTIEGFGGNTEYKPEYMNGGLNSKPYTGRVVMVDDELGSYLLGKQVFLKEGSKSIVLKIKKTTKHEEIILCILPSDDIIAISQNNKEFDKV